MNSPDRDSEFTIDRTQVEHTSYYITDAVFKDFDMVYHAILCFPRVSLSFSLTGIRISLSICRRVISRFSCFSFSAVFVCSENQKYKINCYIFHGCILRNNRQELRRLYLFQTFLVVFFLIVVHKK